MQHIQLVCMSTGLYLIEFIHLAQKYKVTQLKNMFLFELHTCIYYLQTTAFTVPFLWQ